MKYNADIELKDKRKISLETTTEFNNDFKDKWYAEFLMKSGAKAFIAGVKSKTEKGKFQEGKSDKLGEFGYYVEGKFEDKYGVIYRTFVEKNALFSILLKLGSDSDIEIEKINSIIENNLPERTKLVENKR